jgi:surface carbohydrate biosynthesis protein (TIGR04326 family)
MKVQGRNKRLLLFGDIKRETTLRILRVLEHANAKLETPFEVLFKPHPANPIELRKYSKLKAKITEFPIKKLMTMVDVTLSSVFTSADLDAFCSGTPVISYLDPFDFNFSNLREIEGAFFVTSEYELYQVLNQIDAKTFMTGNPEDFFWLDHKLPKWKLLLEGDKKNQFIKV